jgi:hypothetical protein
LLQKSFKPIQKSQITSKNRIDIPESFCLKIAEFVNFDALTPISMKKILIPLMVIVLSSCSDIDEISEPCIVKLNDGTSIVIETDIRINQRTGTITYRDADGDLRSIFQEDYEDYRCGSN